MRSGRRSAKKPQGFLIFGEDRHDIIRKATSLQTEFRKYGQRLDTEHMKPHSDLVTLGKRYKQYEVPIVNVHKHISQKPSVMRK